MCVLSHSSAASAGKHTDAFLHEVCEFYNKNKILLLVSDIADARENCEKLLNYN